MALLRKDVRLWHKDLIPVLPDILLERLWADTLAIANEISKRGKLTEPLVGRILDYPPEHLYTYGMYLFEYVERRGIGKKICIFQSRFPEGTKEISVDEIFPRWHTPRYMRQCYSSLEEMYDCGVITEAAWCKINAYIYSSQGGTQL